MVASSLNVGHGSDRLQLKSMKAGLVAVTSVFTKLNSAVSGIKA